MNPGMMKKFRKMQEEMTDAQEKLEAKEYFGKASGITVIVQGSRQVIDVQIDDELLEEKELLQDAILIAINNALDEIDKDQKNTMQKFAGGLGMF